MMPEFKTGQSELHSPWFMTYLVHTVAHYSVTKASHKIYHYAQNYY